MIATEILGEEVQSGTRPIELVGFAEADSFWRDLRRTLFSGSDYTVYAPGPKAQFSRHRGPRSRSQTSSNHYRLNSVTRLCSRCNNSISDANRQRCHPTQRLQLSSNWQTLLLDSKLLRKLTPDSALVKKAVETAIPVLASATTTEKRRRAFDPVAQAVSGGHVNRELLDSQNVVGTLGGLPTTFRMRRSGDQL